VKRVADLAWEGLADELSREGYAIVRDAFDAPLVRRLAGLVDTAPTQLSLDATASPSVRYSLDDDALPEPLGPWRDALYQRIVPLANHWHERMGLPPSFPPTWSAFRAQNVAAGQRRSLCFVDRLGAKEFSSLRQDVDGEHVFPVQVVALLSAPGVDFTGGELVMTEQRPRMQSRPIVVPLGVGDIALIATAKRPVQGSQGFYAVNTRHAVSRVRTGARLGFKLSFHAAPEG
jgi:hypothetical protein